MSERKEHAVWYLERCSSRVRWFDLASSEVAAVSRGTCFCDWAY